MPVKKVNDKVETTGKKTTAKKTTKAAASAKTKAAVKTKTEVKKAASVTTAKTKAVKKPRNLKAREIPLKELEKTAKITPDGRLIIESPLYPKSSPNVTSSHTENIYGRHYIIDSNNQLPEIYGKDRLTVLVRDPEWIFAFWELSENKIKEAEKILGSKEFLHSKKIIRVYDMTDKHEADESDAHDIELSKIASSWYIHVKHDSVYMIELGFLSPKGDFVVLLKSNHIETPNASMSSATDEKWMVKDSTFNKLYELSGGKKIGLSSADIMQIMARGMKTDELTKTSHLLTPGAGVSSETLSSQAMLEKKAEEEAAKKERKFWMVLNTELIVYGATEPDASVTIMGQPIKLREDGTFSIRMALPDTNIDIPVKGTSYDKIDEITITPIVKKHTNYSKNSKE